MKKKAGFLLIKGETLPYDVVVCLGPTKEELLAHFDKNFIGALTRNDIEALGEGKSKGRVIRCENNAYILWLMKYPTRPEDFGYLAHEIFHVADLMLRKAGASLSDDSDEIWAYQIDWLTKRIYTAFKF